MQLKTHIALGAFAAVFLLPHVNNKVIFVLVVMIASLLPDIDSGFANHFRKGVMRRISFLSGHRGIFHSFNFCFVMSVVFALYWPILALPFFLGYALHLLADSWTVDGIRPFWPHSVKLNGRVKEGGVVEETVFIIFVILDIIFFVLLFL